MTTTQPTTAKAAKSTATPTFEYTAMNAAGKTVKGTMEAANEKTVQARLRAAGIWATDITEKVPGTGLHMEISIPGLGKRVKGDDLAMMSRQLSTMVASGVSLLHSITVVSEQTKNSTLREAMGDVRAQVEQGSAFSVALRRHPRIFPPLMCSLIEAGETGGFLDKSLNAVAGNFEKSVKLQGQIKSALTYPVVVLIIAVVAVIAMLTFIVPVFEKMFKDFGGSLPVPTQILVNISHAMPIVLPILIVVVIAVTAWWRANRNKASVRARIDPLKLKIWVFGKLMHQIAIARFARNFATMMSSGVPMLQALQIVGETSGNYVIEQACHRVQEGVRKGKPLSQLLAGEPVFPNMLVQMLGVGEDSGAMDAMLDKVADFYDDQVDTATKQLSAMMEPLMIVIMGIILGFMVIALYMPMFTIYNSISSSST